MTMLMETTWPAAFSSRTSPFPCLSRVHNKQAVDKGTGTTLPWAVPTETFQRDTCLYPRDCQEAPFVPRISLDEPCVRVWERNAAGRETFETLMVRGECFFFGWKRWLNLYFIWLLFKIMHMLLLMRLSFRFGYSVWMRSRCLRCAICWTH